MNTHRMGEPRGALFQGWRYLTPADAARRICRAGGDEAMPAPLRRELAELGLL